MEDREFLGFVREELKSLSGDVKEGFSGLHGKIDSLSERTTRLEERGKISSKLMLALASSLVILGVVWRAVL